MLELINSSALTKFMAIVFVFLCLVTALIVLTVYLCDFKSDPPQYVTGILYAGIAASINILGVHIGAVTSLQGGKQSAT